MTFKQAERSGGDRFGSGRLGYVTLFIQPFDERHSFELESPPYFWSKTCDTSRGHLWRSP